MTLSRRHLIASSAAFAAGAAPLINAQDGGDEDVIKELSAEEELLERLQGGWALRELDTPDFSDRGRKERAFMVIGGTFLSIDVQLLWDSQEGDEWVKGFFQSGVSRIWIERSNTLVSRSMMGVITDEDYTLQIEPSGEDRRYSVRFQEKNDLILNMEDGPRFVFRRLYNGSAKGNAAGRRVEPTDR